MRVNINPDHTEFVKQVTEVRRGINDAIHRPGQAQVTARFLQASYIPFLATVRTELRDEVVPGYLMIATGDLIGELATTMVQSLYDAPVDTMIQGIEVILDAARKQAAKILQHQAMQERDAAEAAKPKFSIVASNPETPTQFVLRKREQGRRIVKRYPALEIVNDDKARARFALRNKTEHHLTLTYGLLPGQDSTGIDLSDAEIIAWAEGKKP
jgi:hypothetical protein